MRDAAQRAARRRQPVRPAVAAAAREMLTELFGDVRARPLPRAPRGAAARMGRAAALPLVQRARTDGATASWTGGVPTGVGVWVPTPPAHAAPVDVMAGTWRPWNLSRPGELRPPPPVAVDSDAFDKEVQAVYADLAVAVGRAAADRRGVGRRPGQRHAAGPLEPDRARSC